MKLTALSIALIAALGMTAGCSTQNTLSQTSRPAATAADAQAQYALGRYYQGQQRYELAIEAYRRALAANPAHTGAHNGLGASLLLAGRNAEAIDQFKSGLRHEPGSAPLWNNLGYAYALSGEHGLAEMAYKQSLNLDPTDLKTHTNLAVVQQAIQVPAAVAQVPAQPQAAQTAAVETRTVPVHPGQSSTPIAPAAATAPIQATTAPAQPEATQTAIVETRTVPVYPSQAIAPAAETVAVQAASAPIMTSLSITRPAIVQSVAAPAADKPASVEPVVKLQPSTGLASAPIAAPAVKVVEVAPRVYEMKLRDTNAVATAQPAPAAGAAHISIPLRDAAIQMASINPADFVLEIRNGNGVRHMALRTSQYLADYGYTTRRLTNQRGFNVRVTRVFYLPGYIEEAAKLMAHLPKDTVLTETSNLRRGIHVRVVLGKDMVQHQAALDAAKEKIQLAALQP